MSDKVIVVLNRPGAIVMGGLEATVEGLADSGFTNYVDAEDHAEAAVRAALDCDPGELEERVADVIEALDGQDYLDVAAAVLAALEEGGTE